eukprot:2026497-Prymnesium_polylepis.1
MKDDRPSRMRSRRPRRKCTRCSHPSRRRLYGRSGAPCCRSARAARLTRGGSSECPPGRRMVSSYMYGSRCWFLTTKYKARNRIHTSRRDSGATAFPVTN